MGEPYPLITYIFCSTVCLIVMCIIGPQKNKEKKKKIILNSTESTQTTEVDCKDEIIKKELF